MDKETRANTLENNLDNYSYISNAWINLYHRFSFWIVSDLKYGFYIDFYMIYKDEAIVA